MRFEFASNSIQYSHNDFFMLRKVSFKNRVVLLRFGWHYEWLPHPSRRLLFHASRRLSNVLKFTINETLGTKVVYTSQPSLQTLSFVHFLYKNGMEHCSRRWTVEMNANAIKGVLCAFSLWHGKVSRSASRSSDERSCVGGSWCEPSGTFAREASTLQWRHI